jgi:hypothetical protein
MKALEQKMKELEQRKAADNAEMGLAALRRYLRRSLNLFDRYEAVELLQALLRMARSENHDKADEYAASL